MHAADRGATIEPVKIQAAVNAAMENGRVAVPQGDAVMTMTAGKLSVANVMLQAEDGAALSLAGVLDLGNAMIDARLTLAANPPANSLIQLRPEFAVAIKGPLAAPARTLDIAALTSWLTLRATELQTRRLESIEANRRKEVIGPAIRPEFPAVRTAPAGAVMESEIAVSMPRAQMPGAQGVERLRPPPSALPPAAPHAAAADKHAPLDLLFRPQN
jgi:large subunit ribosomal protein L24